ncbi:histidine kinase [Arcicella sp. LKC2W]|uniref:sensor histidine kinase n=1 Tax=Arcicella sp. LKC2W TaxID=2984198 RepID=UPI002B1FA33B|nr:histidine kinase [Arcicella sp. LKC2W]MEA5459339.1 histidine kinase [Arcicella sp. LKC2W]
MLKKNILFWFAQFCCWTLIAYTALSYSPLHENDVTGRLVFFLSYFFVGFLVGYIYSYILEDIKPDDFKTIQFLLYPLLGSCSIGLFFTALDYFLGGLGFPDTLIEILSLYIQNVWLVVPCFFFYHLYHFSVIYQDKQQQTIKAENLLQISELENLKKQLNPHFLFNALNSIKALTISDGKLARESIIQLSDLLRLSLNLGEQQRATLSEEIRLAQNYLSLEKLRFDHRLNYTFKIQSDLDNVLIMPMSLNTLLENAVKHGIGQLKSGGEIIISATAEKNIISLAVENSGTYDPKPKSDEGGIGLDNLQKRLELQYGAKASFTIINDNKKVKAVVKMPY